MKMGTEAKQPGWGGEMVAKSKFCLKQAFPSAPGSSSSSQNSLKDPPQSLATQAATFSREKSGQVSMKQVILAGEFQIQAF